MAAYRWVNIVPCLFEEISRREREREKLFVIRFFASRDGKSAACAHEFANNLMIFDGTHLIVDCQRIVYERKPRHKYIFTIFVSY